MTQMSLSQIKAAFTALFQINTTGDIEADEVDTVLQNFADSVTFRTPPGPATITVFNIRGQARSVPAGTILSGTVIFDYVVSDPSQISGNGTLLQGATTLATDIDPAGSSRNIAINNVTLAAGQSQVFTLRFTDTNTNTVEKTFTVTAAALEEHVYLGVDADGDPSNFDINAGTTTGPLFVTGRQSIVMPTFTGFQYVVYAQQSNEPAVTEINIDGLNQRNAFTVNANAFQVGGQNFDAYVTNNTIDGTAFSGKRLEIVR